MGFAETFAKCTFATYCLVKEGIRREEARNDAPKVEPAFRQAVQQLAKLTARISENLTKTIPQSEYQLDLIGGTVSANTKAKIELVERLNAFPQSLQFYYSNDHSVILYSTDRWLERALYFGTRDLPRLRPIEFLVHKMVAYTGPTSLVFTARDFRKFNEYQDKEWRRENLRTVATHYQ